MHHKSVVLLVLSLLGLIFQAVPARADDALPSSVSTTASPLSSSASKLLENVTSSYFGALSGTNLEFRGFHPNPDATDSGLLGVWNTLGAGYKITPDIQIDAQLVWDWFIAGGHRFVMNPPRIGVSGQVYTSDYWSVWGNLNSELPVTQTARDAGLLTSVGTWDEIWFNPTRTGRLQFGAFHSLRVFFYSEEGEGARFSGNITPLVRYRLAPGFDAQLGYSVDYELARGESTGALSTGLQQFQPGFNWAITPKVSVMPYLIIQPQGEMSLASTAFGAWVSGTIL